LTGPKEQTDVVEADASEEAWIRGGNDEQSIRVRNLRALQARGVAVTEARLVEHQNETWGIWMRLSDRGGEFRLNHAKFDEAKTYKDVALAINAIRQEFAYFGTIAISTDRTPGSFSSDA
jgi:hypothetical protein